MCKENLSLSTLLKSVNKNMKIFLSLRLLYTRSNILTQQFDFHVYFTNNILSAIHSESYSIQINKMSLAKLRKALFYLSQAVLKSKTFRKKFVLLDSILFINLLTFLAFPFKRFDFGLKQVDRFISSPHHGKLMRYHCLIIDY